VGHAAAQLQALRRLGGAGFSNVVSLQGQAWLQVGRNQLANVRNAAGFNRQVEHSVQLRRFAALYVALKALIRRRAARSEDRQLTVSART
jgi:hypothetical protein